MPSQAIRVACPVCGTVEVPTDAAWLELAFDGPEPVNRLQYRCGRCGRQSSQELSERGTRLVMAAGVGLVSAPTSVDTVADTPGGEHSD